MAVSKSRRRSLVTVALRAFRLEMFSALNRRFAADVERLLCKVARAPVRIGLGVLIPAIFFGGILFSVFERDASVIDGWYWATVVAPTVGFGDFSPKTIGGRWVFEFVVAAGKFGEILIAGAFVGAIAARRIQRHEDTPELDDDFDYVIGHLERLKGLTTDPRVKAALRDAAADPPTGSVATGD